MANLVDNHMVDEISESLACFRPFVEQRSAEQQYAIGEDGEILHRLIAHRTSLIQTGQLVGISYPHIVEQFARRPVLHLEDYVRQVACERLRNARKRLTGEPFDIVKSGRKIARWYQRVSFL